MLGQRVKQISRRPGWSFQIVVAGSAGLVLGAASLRFSPLLVLGALAAFFIVLITIRRPEVALLGILINTSTIIVEGRSRVPIINKLYFSDIILLFLFGIIIVRWMVEHDFKIIRTPLDWPFLLFYGVALLSTCIAILNLSVTFSLAVAETRYLSYYLIFFVVTNLVRTERQLMLLLKGFFLLATLVAALMLVQFFLGESVRLLPGRVETLVTEGRSYDGVTRIIPPGESLIVVAFITTTVILVLDKFRPMNLLRFLQWSLFGLAVVLTFNRSFWVSVGLALLLLAYVVSEQDRQRLIKWGLVVLFGVAVLLVPVFNIPESRAAKLARASFERLASLGSSKTFQAGRNSTLRWRDFEYTYALPQIASHPLLGLGLGSRYRPFVRGIDYEGYDGRGYLHNAHLWIMLKSGLLGYFAMVWLSLAFLRRGFKYWRHVPDRQMRGIMLGFTLTYLGVFISSIVNPMLTQWFWTSVIGIMMGVNEIILKKAKCYR